MKVLPQKSNKQPKYPKTKDICKLSAALVLTTSTLVGITSCKENSKAGRLVKADIIEPTTTTEEVIIGGEAVYEPDMLEYDDSGKYAQVDYCYAADEEKIDLSSGDILVLGEKTSYCRVSGISIGDVEEGSEFYNAFPKENFYFYDTWDGDIIVIDKSCSDCYVDYVELAGEVMVYGVFDITEYAIDSNGTTVDVESTYYDEPYTFCCGLESYQISGETFYVAKNVRLSDIEEDSDFYGKFSKEYFDFYETDDNDVVIIKKDSDNLIFTLPILDGVAAPEDL